MTGGAGGKVFLAPRRKLAILLGPDGSGGQTSASPAIMLRVDIFPFPPKNCATLSVAGDQAACIDVCQFVEPQRVGDTGAGGGIRASAAHGGRASLSRGGAVADGPALGRAGPGGGAARPRHRADRRRARGGGRRAGPARGRALRRGGASGPGPARPDARSLAPARHGRGGRAIRPGARGRGAHRGLLRLRRGRRRQRGAAADLAARDRTLGDALRPRPDRRGLRAQRSGDARARGGPRPDRLRRLRHAELRADRGGGLRRHRSRPPSGGRDAAAGGGGRQSQPPGRERGIRLSLRGGRGLPVPRCR